MSAISVPRRPKFRTTPGELRAPNPRLPSDVLLPGDHLTQEEFHRRYEQYHEDTRFELIEGVVIMPAAASFDHSREMSILNAWLCVYSVQTPGTRSHADGTTILGPEDEVQPDGTLIILPEHGGQTRYVGKYLVGGPELVAEIAVTSKNYDLHSKRRVYEKAGVREYVVYVIADERIVWFVRKGKRLVERKPDADGFCRSRVFPGLWLDEAALAEGDGAAVMATLQRGLASPEHAAFVEALAARVRK